MRRGSVAAVLLLLLVPSPSAVARQGNGSVRVVTVAHGVRLTMSLPRTRYPANALVAAQVSVRNVSKSIHLLIPLCARPNPGIEVLTPRGKVGYPPPLHFIPTSQLCPPGEAQAFRPGQTFRQRVLVILRSTVLRAYWKFTIGGDPVGTRQGQIMSKRVTMRLVPGRAPRVTIETAPRVSARVRPVRGATGSLRYVQVASCPTPSGLKYVQDAEWRTAAGTRIVAPCKRPAEWRVVAGWVGQPVAYIHYTRRARSGR